MSDLIWPLGTCIPAYATAQQNCCSEPSASNPFMLDGGTLPRVTFGVYCPSGRSTSTNVQPFQNLICPDSKRAYPTFALNYPTLLRHSGGSANPMELCPRKVIVVPLWSQ
jgi:hypothetical protein